MAIASRDIGKRNRRLWLQVPHVYAIIFGLIVLAAGATYVVPAGVFDRAENSNGLSVVVDGSYHAVASAPTQLMEIFTSVHRGMVEAAPIIFFIFIVGGAFGVFRATGTADAAVSAIAARAKGREVLVIPVLMTFFALGGAVFGLAEETIPYIMIVTPLAIMLGYDSLVGAGVVLVGAAAGFSAAFLNPFTVGVAQGIAGLPLFSGVFVRLVFWAIFVGVSIAYVTWYAVKIRRDPSKSSVRDDDLDRSDLSQETLAPMNTRQVIILSILLLTVLCLAFGVISFGWYIAEISGLFPIMAILMAIVGRMSVNATAEAFVTGCISMTMGALVVGLAYGVLAVLKDANIMDTIIFSMSNAVRGLPPELSALGMYGTQGLMNFVVPSGSGQAALSMPIMAPLADLVGVDRQTAVLAFQFGDGISNILTPTSGYFMAALAAAGVSWTKWVRWIWPLILIQYVLGAVFVMTAHLFIWN